MTKHAPPKFETFEPGANGSLKLVPSRPEASSNFEARKNSQSIADRICGEHSLYGDSLLAGRVGKTGSWFRREAVTASLYIKENTDGTVSAVYTQGYEGGGRFELGFSDFPDFDLAHQISLLPDEVRANLEKLLAKHERIDLTDKPGLVT